MMFRSRHTIALLTTLVYFIPLFFLTLYGMGAVGSAKMWSFFSLGIFFSIGGSLILFSLLIQYESSLEEDVQEPKEESDAAILDELERDPLVDFDEIILNLNQELALQREEIKKLKAEKEALKVEKENESFLAIEKSEIPKNWSQSFEKVEIEEETAKAIDEEVVEDAFEEEKEEVLVPTPTEIENQLYSRSNRVEVTRL